MACLFAARFAPVSQVQIVDTWEEAITAIRERGITLEDAGKIRSVRVTAGCLGDAVQPADLAIVLVKSWQTQDIARHLAGSLKPDGMAISLQNGLGNLEALGAKAFPGVTSEGATLLAPGRVRSGGRGPTYIVAPGPIVKLFKDAGFETYGCASQEAESLIWGKLAISCGINALTALLRICNGELLERADAADLMVRATMECAAVAKARGVALPFPDPESRVREVAERTAENRSSMLQDILRGAPTECDAINGAVVREGIRLKIPTPVNDVLWRLVRAAAQQNRSNIQ